MPDLEVWDIEKGQPPKLIPFLGRRVYRAWILPGGRCLAIRIEGGVCMMLEAMRSDYPDRPLAIEVSIGDEKPGADFSDMDELPQNYYLKAIRGMKLTGMVGNTLSFDGRYGAEFHPDRIRWVLLY